MNICLFESSEIECPQPSLSFDDVRGRHILEVLHKKAGDDFTAGIIDGKSGLATITKIDDSARKIFFDFTPTGDGKPLNPLIMIVGFPRPIQLRRLLRDVAALGVRELHLTGTELGEKSYMQSDLAQPEKARELLLEGTVQAGSTHVPRVFIHKSVRDCLESMNCQGSLRLSKDPLLICLDNVNPKCSLSEAISGAPAIRQAQEPRVEGEVIAAIGSERGWTAGERKLFEDAGFIRCGMGERIMRTETAVTVAGAIILNSMGRLSGQARQ